MKLTLANGRFTVNDAQNGKEIIRLTDNGISKGKMKFLMVTSGWGSSGMWTVTDVGYEQKRIRKSIEEEEDLGLDYEHAYDGSYLYEYSENLENSDNGSPVTNSTMVNDYPEIALKFSQEEENEGKIYC